jgi:hypothetical protein
MPVEYTRFRTEWSNLRYFYARAWSSRGSIIPARILGTEPAALRGRVYGSAGMMNAIGIPGSGPGKYSLTRFTAELLAFRMGLERAELKMPIAMNALAQILARVDQHFSMNMSAGPRDPRQQNPSAAWKIPVRRITGAYFQNWHVRRLARGVWVVYNPTREAYYIEYGIHPSGRRVRRPIRKLALIKTLRFADQQNVGQYVWEAIYGHLRETGGRGRGRLSVHYQPQSMRVMGML